MLHATDVLVLLRSDQGHDGAGVAGPAGPARTVHVVHVVGRRVEMDHARQGVDMDAPCHDVGRHQGICLPLGERIKSPLPLTLRAVAVHGNGADPVRL